MQEVVEDVVPRVHQVPQGWYHPDQTHLDLRNSWVIGHGELQYIQFILVIKTHYLSYRKTEGS